MKIDKILASDNLAKDLEEDQLIEIGNLVVDGFDADLESRRDWDKMADDWTKLALQVTEQRTFPWNGAANVKYPLLAIAALQFNARAYPSLIPSDNRVVKCRVIGSDPTGEKTDRASRVSKHMSYQIMDEMEDWEDEMDKLLLTLPILGTCFKKTYWDSTKQVNCSKLVLPRQLVVNYWTRTLEDAERITEVIPMSPRIVKGKQLQQIYRDVDLGDPGDTKQLQDKTKIFNTRPSEDDDTTPHTILEQHTYYDFDDDGYSEPYIITVDYNTREVLRIVPNYSEETILVDAKGKIVGITAKSYYTKYGFIPNPDGGFYDIGFGRLLGPINDTVNTILNQLIDAGSLSNLQSGFIGKGLRMKMGETKFTPGEWKAVNATGDDIKKQIMPLPVREPSNVLFQLLNLLVQSGKELASVAEIMTGKMPGQNTPATTTMATIEQGMKVFTAVYKRVFRSMTKEFRKIYLLNKEYLNPEEYIDVIDETVQQSDYQGPDKDILPAADPQAVSQTEKVAKAERLLQVMGLGTLNPMEVTKRVLDAQEQPNAEQLLMPPQPPQPDPKVQALQAKAQIDQQKAMNDMQIATQKAELERASKEQELVYKAKLQEMEIKFKQMEAMLKAHQAGQQLQQNAVSHQQQMHHAEQAAQQKAVETKRKVLSKKKE